MKNKVRRRGQQRVKSRTKRKIMPKQSAPSQLQAESPHIKSKEEDLIYKILERNGARKVPELATLFSHMMSSLTPSIKEVARLEGVRTGRKLYNILSQKHRYLFHEESVADLVKFFEHAGYDRIMYNIFPDKTTIRFYDMPRENIGIKVHSFESGLISGFLSAARNHFVDIEERTCSSNGSEMCSFETVAARPMQQREDPISALRLFCEHLEMEVDNKEKQMKIKAAPEYYVLSSFSILSKAYHKEVEHVAAYVGGEIGSRLLKHQKRAKSGVAESKITKSMELLNLGKPSVKSLTPIKIDIAFDKLHSQSEFVEISLALLNGMLKEYSKSGAKVQKTYRKTGYFIRIIGK